jgi:hypothetical protein
MAMDGEKEREELQRLEAKAEREIEVLEETIEDIREDLDRVEDDKAPFEITVNNKPVRMKGHHHTGLQIKEAAIAAGVKIQLDFVLSEELSHDRSRIVGDEQRIKVEAGSRFEAIPNDDHS